MTYRDNIQKHFAMLLACTIRQASKHAYEMQCLQNGPPALGRGHLSRALHFELPISRSRSHWFLMLLYRSWAPAYSNRLLACTLCADFTRSTTLAMSCVTVCRAAHSSNTLAGFLAGVCLVLTLDDNNQVCSACQSTDCC